MISASCSAPIGAHTRSEMRSAIRAPRGPLAHPAEHVGLRGPVEEPAPVRRLLTQRLQERVEPPLRDPPVELTDLGVRVGVLLEERHPAAHVEQVLHRRAGVPARGELRHVLGHLARGVQQPAVDQDPGHAADHRLGDREHRVGLLRPAGRRRSPRRRGDRPAARRTRRSRCRPGRRRPWPGCRRPGSPRPASTSWSRGCSGSGRTGPSPRGTGWVGSSSRTFQNDHRLTGGSCQFSADAEGSRRRGSPDVSMRES